MRDEMPTEEHIAALREEVSRGVRPGAFVDLSRALSARGEHREAASVAQRGLLSQPDAVEGRLALALAESELGRVREALEQIKRALLIDQENVEALCLMGRILLDRGLAQRAVQFLSHAVKNAPDDPDVRALSARAQAAAYGQAPPAKPASGSVPVAAFGPGSVKSGPSPWDSEDAQTVFAPDAAAESQTAPAGLDARLAALPSVREDADETEPTRLATQTAGAEDATLFAPSIPRRRGKMGGSADELSRMLRAELPAGMGSEDDEEGPTTALPPDVLRDRLYGGTSEEDPGPATEQALPVPAGLRAQPIPSDVDRTVSDEDEASAAAAPPPKRRPAPPRLPPVEAEASPPAPSSPAPSSPAPSSPAPSSPAPSSPAPEAPKAAPEKPAPPAAPADPPASFPPPAPARPAAEAAKKPKPAEEPPAANPRAIGPVATRMVDDALFAILGRRKSVAEAAPAAEAPAPKKRVVRTSSSFGTWTQVAIGALLSASAFGLGYAGAVAPNASAPEVVVEELKNLGADLERGGLAALLAAEERIEELRRANPELAPLLAGAQAEIYARRYHRFGATPAHRDQARALIREAASVPTVELAMAEVLTSTDADRIPALQARFVAAAEAHPQMPKPWLGQARVAARQGDFAGALDRLSRARALHPQHRQSLLESARWLARRGATASSLEIYAELQRLHDLDVEVAIERYLLGWVSGADVAHDEAVAALAGLVREEIPEVAKDEAGRASLAFALDRLRAGRVQEALQSLGDAEGAFSESPVFQRTMGEVFLALGEGARAAACFERAIAASDSPQDLHRALARARFAETQGYRLETDLLRRQVLRLQRGEPRGEVRLPYGRLVAEPTRFELVRVVLEPEAFPEAAFDAAERAMANGAEPGPAYHAALLIGRAETELTAGRLELARKHLEASHAELPLAWTKWVEGRLAYAEGRPEVAAEALTEVVRDGVGGLAAQLVLARARNATGDEVGALEAYRAFFAGGGSSSQALLEQTKLQIARRDDEGALASLRSLAALEPDRPAAFVLEAELLYAQGRGEEATSWVRRALERAPTMVRGTAPPGLESMSPAVLTEVANLTMKANRTRAVGLLRTAMATEGAPPDVHFLLGKALVARRKTRKEGRRELARYLSLAPEGPHAAEAERLTRRR